MSTSGRQITLVPRVSRHLTNMETPSTPATPDFSARLDTDSMLLEMRGMESLSSFGLAFNDNQTQDIKALGQPHIDPDMASFSDSDGGREGVVVFYSSALDSESQSVKPKDMRRKNTGATGSSSLLLSPKGKRSMRRKSRNSEGASERSRSEYQGSGYTLTPTTGKIFRNLLILEESLRQQVIQQRTLRRKYLTFLATLCSLIASISHHLYFNEQLGPSRVALQLVVLALVVTLLLYHLSGEYQKTIVLPRKFLSLTNKGLRQLNVRLVKIKTSFAHTWADLVREFGLFLCIMALSILHTLVPSTIHNPRSKLEVWLVSAQLRCQPRFGLNDVKIVLFPRSFSTDIREGWELYRNEFWINEGMRRRKALLGFLRPSVESERKAQPRKDRKVRKRKLSTPQNPNLSEQTLKSLGTMSPETISPYQSA